MRARFFVAVGLAVSGLALAQTKTIEGLPIRPGDSIEKVKTALRTTLEPEESKSALQRNTKQLRLKTKGIWAFFDPDGRVYNIRLDAPFRGNVGGVKIGDSRATLVEKLGKPAKLLKGATPRLKQEDPYVYYIDDRTTVRFDFNRSAEIETVFILK